MTTLLCGLVVAIGCAPAPAEGEAARAAGVAQPFGGVGARYPEGPTIDRPTLISLGDRVLLVDVRPIEERSISTIPGAVTESEFDQIPLSEDLVVVAYCTVGERSARFAREQRSRGVEVRNLAGGLLGWAHEGGEFVTADGESARRAHVYGRRWDLLPEGFEGVTRN